MVEKDTFLKNLTALEFPFDEVKSRYGLDFAIGTTPRKEKAFPIVMQYFFRKLDAEKCTERFRYCFPVFQKTEESKFRIVCRDWLKELQDRDLDFRRFAPSYVYGLLVNPSGSKYFRFLTQFSNYVLKKEVDKLAASQSLKLKDNFSSSELEKLETNADCFVNEANAVERRLQKKLQTILQEAAAEKMRLSSLLDSRGIEPGLVKTFCDSVENRRAQFEKTCSELTFSLTQLTAGVNTGLLQWMRTSSVKLRNPALENYVLKNPNFRLHTEGDSFNLGLFLQYLLEQLRRTLVEVTAYNESQPIDFGPYLQRLSVAHSQLLKFEAELQTIRLDANADIQRLERCNVVSESANKHFMVQQNVVDLLLQDLNL